MKCKSKLCRHCKDYVMRFHCSNKNNFLPFFFFIFFNSVQCYLFACGAICVRTMLFLCAQCYFYAYSIINVPYMHAVASMWVQWYFYIHEWFFMWKKCYLCAYSPIFVCIVPLMWVQCYLCTHSVICVLTVLFMSARCHLCAYNAVHKPQMLLKCCLLYRGIVLPKHSAFCIIVSVYVFVYLCLLFSLPFSFSLQLII